MAVAPAETVVTPGATTRRSIPVVLPSIRDPRLHLAVTISTVQVLGQTVFDFDLSIAQILLSVGTCALLELAITLIRERQIVWPASAMLTGNGVALILRVPGTEHGDWWSLRGWWAFVAVAAFSLLSKFVLRWDGRHFFNPSNLGLVVGVMAFRWLPVDVLNDLQVDLQDLWWGPISPGLVVTLAVIGVGAITITRRLGLLGAALAFYATFAAGTAIVAASGHSIAARWRLGPLEDWSYWWVLVTSPEILIFLFFMITDPKTIPAGRLQRMAFGVVVGLIASFAVAPLHTELRVKLAVLASLVLGCALRPLVERFVPADATSFAEVLPRVSSKVRRVAVIPSTGALVGLLLLAAIPARPEATSAATAKRPILFERADLPRVSVDGSARGISPTMTTARAEGIAFDVLNSLEVERAALATGDADLAATAIAGARLRYLREAMAARGTFETQTYVFEVLTIVIVRGSPQSPPRVQVHAQGRLDTGDAAVVHVSETFYLAASAEGYVIASPVPVLVTAAR